MKTVTMNELPECYFCKQQGRDPVEPAVYDAQTVYGPFAYMCQEHYDVFGGPIGTRLVLPTKYADELIERADEICMRCGKGCSDKSWNKTEIRFRLLDKPSVVEFMLSAGLYCEEAMV